MDTFIELCRSVLRYFDLANEATDSIDFELVKDAVNRAHQARCVENKWKFMFSPVKTLAVVPGQQSYVLPVSDLNKLHYLYSTGNKIFCNAVEDQSLQNEDLGVRLNDNADQARFYELNKDASMKSPLWVTAGDAPAEFRIYNAADAGKGWYIEGLDADGIFVAETVLGLMTGPVALKNDYDQVTYIAKTDEFVGESEINLAGDGDTLLNLGATEHPKKYPVLTFKQIPQKGDTMLYRYFKQPRTLTRDGDSPNIPFPHSGIIVYDALLDMATYSELDSESVNIWRDKQTQFLGNLYLENLVGDTVGGRVFHTSMNNVS
jgi:hypothetical protein